MLGTGISNLKNDAPNHKYLSKNTKENFLIPEWEWTNGPCMWCPSPMVASSSACQSIHIISSSPCARWTESLSTPTISSPPSTRWTKLPSAPIISAMVEPGFLICWIIPRTNFGGNMRDDSWLVICAVHQYQFVTSRVCTGYTRPCTASGKPQGRSRIGKELSLIWIRWAAAAEVPPIGCCTWATWCSFNRMYLLEPWAGPHECLRSFILKDKMPVKQDRYIFSCKKLKHIYKPTI